MYFIYRSALSQPSFSLPKLNSSSLLHDESKKHRAIIPIFYYTTFYPALSNRFTGVNERKLLIPGLQKTKLGTFGCQCQNRDTETHSVW